MRYLLNAVIAVTSAILVGCAAGLVVLLVSGDRTAGLIVAAIIGFLVASEWNRRQR